MEPMTIKARDLRLFDVLEGDRLVVYRSSGGVVGVAPREAWVRAHTYDPETMEPLGESPPREELTFPYSYDEVTIVDRIGGDPVGTD